MSLLSNAFPEDFKKQYADRSLEIGTVLRVKVDDTNPPKIKYFIIIGFSKDKVALGVVYINSEINPNLFQSEELRQLHIPLKRDDRNIVEWDCFIDCSKITEKNVQYISELLQSQPEINKGQLSSIEIGNVQQKLYYARTISIRSKRKFGIM